MRRPYATDVTAEVASTARTKERRVMPLATWIVNDTEATMIMIENGNHVIA